MNDHEPHVELELSQEELQELYQTVAQSLVFHGDVAPAEDVEPIAGEPKPSRFRADLDRTVLASVVDLGDDWFVTNGYIDYTTAHATSTEPFDDPLGGVVYFQVVHRSAEAPDEGGALECTTSYALRKQYGDGTVTGVADTEYTKDGYRVSFNNIEYSRPKTDEYERDLMYDVGVLQRPLGADEWDKLLSVAASIADQP